MEILNQRRKILLQSLFGQRWIWRICTIQADTFVGFTETNATISLLPRNDPVEAYSYYEDNDK